MGYRVLCNECQRVVLSTERIGDPEAATLAEHLRSHHPGILAPEHAPAFAKVLHYFEVQQDDE